MLSLSAFPATLPPLPEPHPANNVPVIAAASMILRIFFFIVLLLFPDSIISVLPVRRALTMHYKKCSWRIYMEPVPYRLYFLPCYFPKVEPVPYLWKKNKAAAIYKHIIRPDLYKSILFFMSGIILFNMAENNRTLLCTSYNHKTVDFPLRSST